jgi:transposase
MDRYIGLDVHAQSCTIAVVGPSGKRIRLWVVDTKGEALIQAIRSVPGRRHLCLEEGTQSQWLYELLEPHVHELVVVVPKKKDGPKSDARDAWARAEELRIGAVETRVFKAPGVFTGLRDAARGYGLIVQDTVRVKNRLKAVFRARGVAVGREVYRTEDRATCVEQLPASSQHLAELLGQELDHLLSVRASAEQWLQEEAKRHPVVHRLATVPGLGTTRAAQIAAIVVTPHRFRTKRQFWSYAGLAIVTRSSADWERDRQGKWMRKQVMHTRGLNRNRQPMLKAIFKGAATTIIAQMREHPLNREYQRLTEAGTKPNLAKLTVARKLAAITLAVWKHQEVYDPAKHAKPSTTTA